MTRNGASGVLSFLIEERERSIKKWLNSMSIGTVAKLHMRPKNMCGSQPPTLCQRSQDMVIASSVHPLPHFRRTMYLFTSGTN